MQIIVQMIKCVWIQALMSSSLEHGSWESMGRSNI